MGISSSMYVALSGMNLSQAGMEVASHNIANVNTPGYSRQRLNLETTPTWKSSYGQMGTGVSAQNITRYHDEFLTRSIVSKSTQYGYAAAQKSAIDALEAFFNESDGNGVNAALNEFWANWDNIADAAELDPTREALIGVAETLANQLNMRREDMDAIRQDLNARIENAVQDINSIIKSIASLNQEIMRSEDPGRNQQANDLRDTRDALITQLGELIDIDYWEDPINGAVNISFFSGPALVMGDSYYEVGGEIDESGDMHIIANNRRASPPWPEDVTGKINGGAVGGWIEFRDTKMRDFYLKYESFVDQLIFQVNNQHAQGVGQDLYNGTITGSSLVSNLPSYNFSFNGPDNDLKLTALVPHLDHKEPYSAKTDPENISVRFVKSETPTKEVTSSVVWNDDPAVKKWEITITLPTDSNGNVVATAEDVIRHINTEKSQTPTSGVATLPPQSMTWPYKIGDFISAESAAGNNWTGTVNFPGYSVPTGVDQYISLDRSLANVMNQGHHLSYGSEKARLATSLKHTDNDLLFTANKTGAAGENIAIEYVNNGPNQPLGVSVSIDPESGAQIISVSLATDADGKVTTVARDIKDLINGDSVTRELITAEISPDQTEKTGLGLVKEMDATFLDRSGYFEIVTYDESGEPAISRVTVDPTDTLQDVVKRIGTTFDTGIKGILAEVVTDQNGQDSLRIVSDTDNKIQYGFRNDTSGALAVLGLNNIFTGDSSATIGVNQDIAKNPRLLASGRITSDGVITAGDNANALDMADLKDQRYSFYNLSSATLGTAFNTFYADIGSTNRTITTEHDFVATVLDEMYNKQDALAGVNLDEELADILRFQYMYQASAKMISTIDSMMETLLAMR